MKRPKQLSATFIKTTNKPGRYGDGRGGHGLSLLVKHTKSGRLSKTWAQRLRINGKLTNIGLGKYPVVNLKEAREKALENLRAVTQGKNPRAGNSIPTFEQAAEAVIKIYEPSWKKGARSADIWRQSLRDYILPRLGNKKVDKINSADILACLLPNWQTKNETMKRTKQRVSIIMRWCVTEGYRLDDPTTSIDAALPKANDVKKHMRSLLYSEVPKVLCKVWESNAAATTKLAFEFLILTAARSGEVRLATWDEVNLAERVWIIPASRMKTKKEHRVPLSDTAMTVLGKAREFADSSGLIFPSVTGKPLSDNTLSKLLRDLKIQAVPHGFRSSFRDFCAESGVTREAAEASLAHVVGGVEGAYFRSTVFELRRQVMQDWADYLSKK